jgi:hypothetical protein
VSADRRNLPRFRGQRGFYEIWFLVVFAPSQERAYWLRYTLFSPARGRPERPRAIVWAAAFDARAERPAVALKSMFPVDDYHGDAASFHVRIGESELSEGCCRGAVQSEAHRLSWDLRFSPVRPAHGGPWLMSHRLPLPTRVVHAHEGAIFDGTFVVDGAATQLCGALGLQKHIWGTRRVDELFWLYCPRFEEDPSARLEAVSVRLKRRLLGAIESPALTPVWLETAAGPTRFEGVLHLLHNEVRFERPARLRVRAASATRALEVVAHCDPRSLVGYVYRDPRGHDLYVTQSDIASCEVETFSRAGRSAPLQSTGRLTSRHAAAIEVHLPGPLDHVDYIGWDERGLGGERA